MHVELASHAFIVLLPAPVSCWTRASYAQTQRFDLPADRTASVVLLDWLSSGREARGERWAFARCRTENVVRIGGKAIARDVLLLEDDGADPDVPSYRAAVEPYACYATLILHGPRVRALIDGIAADWRAARTVRQASRGAQRALDDVLWSYCSLDDDRGGIVRCAGRDTELVRAWLRERLRPLEAMLGRDLYRNAWT